MLTLDPTLAPICAKVEWAKNHIREIERQAKVFIDSKPYHVITKPDPDVPNGIKYFIEAVRSKPPDAIALLIGDALSNIRSALDHLAYQLAWANGTRDKKLLKATAFPISVHSDPKKYEPAICGKIQSMSQAAQDAIWATKPYKGGTHLLWQLNELNNISKHRLLVTVGAPLGSHNFPPFMRQKIFDLVAARLAETLPDWEADALNELGIDDLTAIPPASFRKCPLEAGDEVQLSFSPILATDKDIDLTFEVAFCEPEIAESEPVVSTLNDMANVVDNILLTFKPLLA